MDNFFLQKWPKVSEGQKLQLKKRILVFSVFLVISVFIWLLNALGKNYTTTMKYPVEYSDFPENKVVVGELPGHLDLKVNAHGYALLRYELFRRPVPISFRVSSYTLTSSGERSNRAFILTRYLKDQIAAQLPQELQLLEIRPDTLQFVIANKSTRPVRIQPDLDFELDKQFTTMNGVSLEPDSVEVSGPDVILDTLQFISTEYRDLGLLSRDYRDELELDIPAGLTLSLDEVKVSIELEKFTEMEITVPVEVLDLPDSMSMQTFPSRIRLTCRVGLSKYERIDRDLFRAVVSYPGTEALPERLEVQIMNIPSYMVSLDYNPRSVEYLITRK